MFVSPDNEGIILVFAQKGQTRRRPQVLRRKKKIQQLQFKLEKKKKNSSPQCSHFLLLGHTPINIYLISNALAHSLFEYLYWISSFFFPTQEFQPFSPLLRNSTKKTKQPQTNKQKNPSSRPECEYDKTQEGAASFSSNKDHVRKCD